MTRTVIAVAIGIALGSVQPNTPPLDPTGTWKYSTVSEDGAPVTGTMEITGKPSAYAGTIASSTGMQLQIVEVMTSAKGMIVLADIPNGGAAVIRVMRSEKGEYSALWGAAPQIILAKVERVK
jgi:hypothetical protein